MKSMKKNTQSSDSHQLLLDLDLLTFVSHQIKTPLTTLKINIDLLKQQISPEQKKLIDIMDEELNTIIRLISESLDLRKMETKPSILLKKWYCWDQLVKNSMQQLKQCLDHKKIQINILPLKHKIESYIDPFYIEQVLVNLITNAIQHSPTNSRVHLKWILTKKSTLQITIEDEGKGIAKKDLNKIFTPFNNPISNQRGLGLMIARQIVLSHGGTIEACTDGSTKGACFMLTLPHARVLSVAA